MRKIKVVQIITRLDWAGAPDILRIICQHLDKNNYEVKIITGPTKYPSNNTKIFLEKFGDNVIIVPWLQREINIFLDFFALIGIYKILRKEKFDILHTHTAKAGALGRLAARLAGNHKTIHMPHGHNFYGYFGFFLSRIIIGVERFLSGATSRFICLSELEKKDMLDFKVGRPEIMKVIQPGVEMEIKDMGQGTREEKKSKFGFTANQKIVGMVSRLEPVKGCSVFIEAASILSGQLENVKFIVVGEGSLRKKLEDRVADLGLSEKIIFTGWRDDALEIISFLDILVQPSLNEAVGRVLIEAQSLGVPVIGTRVGGVPEIINDNITGVLVPAANIEALAAATYGLLVDDQRRMKMREDAKLWVARKFSVQKMVEDIDSLYKEVMAI